MYNINCSIYINRRVNYKCEVVIFLLFSILLDENYIYPKSFHSLIVQNSFS